MIPFICSKYPSCLIFLFKAPVVGYRIGRFMIYQTLRRLEKKGVVQIIEQDKEVYVRKVRA